MKRLTLSKQNFIAISAVLMVACTSTQKVQNESPVGIVTYNQYAVKAPAGTDTSFYVITNQEAFDAAFITSDSDQLPKPGFSGQTVVVIAAPRNGAVKIERATINGKTMRVYAATCNREAADCPKNGLALVTTPKSGSVRNVQFFINGVNNRSIDIK
ncbi:MAG TPA: hypothetical protein VD794_13475 [Flavisolibacter sp.]|nr:hypothetical protein [Flavisolibacter sp.]